jgi:hypothetical protein
MTNNHPITVPAGSITKWKLLYCNYQGDLSETEYIALKSAQLGADQELEACCEWLDKSTVGMAELLRTSRRPKPPSLKEQGLTAMKLLKQRITDPNIIEPLSQAVEQLDD